MSDTYRNLINRVLRDHEGYSGDGRGSVGDLPVGDRSTARKAIDKRDLREVMLALVNAVAVSVPSGAGSPDSPLMMRVFPSSVSEESRFMRIWVPVSGSGYADILLKRGSISTSPTDAGVSQVTWEPDVVDAATDAALLDTASSNVSGTWETATMLESYWVHESNSSGAARSWTFTGTKVRFGYFETLSSSSFDIEIDGVVVASIPTGTAQGRRVWEMSGLPTGSHALVVRRTSTGGSFLRVQGLVVADAKGTMEGTGTMLVERINAAGSYIMPGVQTFVGTVEGGKRMGGGHGGSWLRTSTAISIDGKSIEVDLTDGSYHAGRGVSITESFELKESASAPATALVTRKMTFRAGGYDCDMDIRLPAPVQFRDFFWGMAKAGSAMTRVKTPIDASLTSLPIQTVSQIVAFEGNGLRVEVAADGTVQSTGPDPYSYVAENDGNGKLYNVGALATPYTFTGRQRLRYSVDFAAV